VRIRLSLVRLLVERTGTRRERRAAAPVAEPELQLGPAADARPEPEPATEPERERQPAPEAEPLVVSLPAPEPEPSPAPPHEPEPAVVPLALRDPSPRAWNVWDLERLAGEMNSDSRAEERALLLMHMREFADPSGNLPLEFDPLVRDAFGADLAELVT
jgi:outer membrane biosynthesis protein TonB